MYHTIVSLSTKNKENFTAVRKRGEEFKKGGCIMKKLLCVFLGFLLILTLAGCGTGRMNATTDEESSGNTSYKTYSTSDGATNDAVSGTPLEGEAQNQEQKLIKKVNLRVETAKFDEYISAIRNATSEAKGYVQSFEESDRDEKGYCCIVIRIPADKTDAFLNVAGTGVTVLSRQEEINDVTGEYIDVSARMTALEAEEKALLSLLDKATTVSEMLTVREQLSKVRSDIEAYKATLKNYDNLVAYSTINLTVNGVSREKEKENVWARIGNNFTDAGKNIGDFFVNLFVFILAALPYLAVISVPAIIVLIIIFRKIRKAKKQ